MNNYVDDIILGLLINESLYREFSKPMHGEFKMSLMGELTFFLGLQIKQAKEGTFINKTKYVLKLFKKFDIQDCKSISTPMTSILFIDKDKHGIAVNFKRYQEIMFGVSMCPRYQACPKESHLKIVK